MEFVLSLLVGISLSATCGFRVFVPLLVMSIAAVAGHLELSPAFAWIGSYPALAAFAVATVLEILAYFFPYIDNLVNAASAPVSVLAGIVITAAVILDMGPFLTWALAVVAGGGASLAGTAAGNALHAGSTAATGGVANPVVSLAETVFSTLMAVLAVLVPLLAAAALILGMVLFYKLVKKIRSRRSGAFHRA